MTTNFKTLALAREIEDAFKNHLGTDSFPTAEWPRVALALAHVIERTGLPLEDNESVRGLMRSVAELNIALADLVGL